MNDRPYNLRCGEALRARLVAVVRNHHDTMPGSDRDRPGNDRILVEVAGMGELLVDVWSNARQDVASVDGALVIFESDGLICWRPASTESVVVAAASGTHAPGETESDSIGARRAKVAAG